MHLASSAGISLRNRVVGKSLSKPIRRLEPIERPAEEASMHQQLTAVIL
jgi:hypothetical protein